MSQATSINQRPLQPFHLAFPVTSLDHACAARLKDAGTQFVIEPHIRFKGQVGEQATMFFLDPCGNALEFKAFADIGRLFAR
ncbi:MAG: hypothetical protein EPN70_17175 [Paraburkholderia sp.]|nr:MAG: hypothetical protein EPN70_17175 [Paraburkholderia sp.]TAM30571.1 MAG: hypothetical protein EPN59_08830 [Paraburkholderia sp.]